MHFWMWMYINQSIFIPHRTQSSGTLPSCFFGYVSLLSSCLAVVFFHIWSVDIPVWTHIYAGIVKGKMAKLSY